MSLSWDKKIAYRTRAVRSYKNQKTRTTNPKCKSFKTYGKLGIRVEYSRDQFLEWFFNEIQKGEWVDPVVGRKNHSKNYSLDNIEMVERVSNCRERMTRC